MPEESQPTVSEPAQATPTDPAQATESQAAPVSDSTIAAAIPTESVETLGPENTSTQEVAAPVQTPTETPIAEVAHPISTEAPQPTPVVAPPAQPATDSTPSVVALRPQAQASRTNRIQKKLDKIMEFAREKKTVRNDDIEKLLHVSDSTSQRHLGVLVKQGKLRKIGNRGSTHYELV